MLDSQTKETITGAKVSFGNEIVYSDFDGRFPILEKEDTVRIEFISYKDTIVIMGEKLEIFSNTLGH